MLISIPHTATQYGFVVDGLGAHGSRTIMLAELRLLLDACPPITDMEGFREAIIDDNVLLKRTHATRKESFRRLRELYGLRNQLVVFRALRDLWEYDRAAQPMLALLCAAARDPIVRVTSTVILTATPGDAVTPDVIADAVEQTFPGRLNKTTLANIGRHAASSWAQSGHLKGRSSKVRARAGMHPTSVAYALLLGHLCGTRGEGLFQTYWTRLLDAPAHLLHDQAFSASQLGWLEYRHTGSVTDVGFAYLLREDPPTTHE